ncbi:hypothetical protein NCS57_01159000 [Fusarium keratoplasticum]|uniref:Uncharacterized protein n=1 Tax=Fusarium keratoplasticum TaxID=1328300 RepID=A0ACC0QL05_9HYPO|nr:hypothetical protein NCS57_01159000 [Fusarium keratoplasticum]KAI8657797.1 hypothetical protein NCS57_01159000 [Fusarium keratoplasticum]
MAEHWAMKDDDIKRQALRAMEALETLFSKAKAEVVRSLVYLGNKEMEEGAKKVLHEIIGDLFDYGHDMWLLRRYVDRLQHLKPSMTDKMLRQRVITEYEAGKFDRATPTPQSKAESRGYPGDLMQSLIIRGKASEARSLCDGKGFDDWEYDGSFLSRLDKKLEDWDDRHDLFQTLGEGFVEAVYEGACDLCQFHISVVGEILDSSSTIPELTLLTGRQTGRLRSPLLQASFGSKSKEEILDQAHDNIKLLEVHFDQVKRLAAMMDRIKSHCGLEPGVENALMLVQRMTSILKLDRIVDECLFGDRAVDMAFAKSLDNGVYKECKGLAEDLTTLNTFILAAQVALPRALQAEIDILRRQLSIHPEDPQDAEGQGQRRYPGLGGLLSRNKALALNSLPSLGSHIGFEKPDIVICDMLDIGGDLELLRRYVEKLVHTKTDTATTALDERVVTSFIAGKFDRATSRLASRIKAQISTLEKFAAPRDTRPSDRCAAMLHVLTEQGNPETEEALKDVNLGDLPDHVATLAVLTCKIQADIENNHGALVESLGRDFVSKVLEAAHDLTKADLLTLKQLISNVERMLGLSPAEAAARFPAMSNAMGCLNFLMRHASGQE